MAAVSQPLSRSPFRGESRAFNSQPIKSIPILPSAAAHTTHPPETMDISGQQQHSVPVAAMAPPLLQNLNGDRAAEHYALAQGDSQHSPASGGLLQPLGAAAAAQQPKVVQTAFIHKLYNMLEDQSIQSLISWSASNESFVMSPSSDFSKVLAQYFKHTNISSFVRQLNMYGFHKVSDVFHTGSPDAPLWEFKHGAGNFKRGDLVGLREIKRRASRHALIHRDSFSASTPKMPPPPPQIGMPMEQMTDPVEARLGMLEWNQQDLYARLARTEDAHASVTSKCHALLDGLRQCHQWNLELSSHLLTLVPDPDNPVHREVYAMRQDMARQADQLRSMEEPQEPVSAQKQSFFQTNANPVEPMMPMSPHQRPYDESRRPSLQAVGRPNFFRAPVPPYLQVSPRRHGSIGTSNGAYSPTSTRPMNYPPPPPPPQPQHQQPHPLSNISSPPANLARRHTSADIRVPGWTGQQPLPQYHTSSPYASGHSSSAWPSSPRLGPPSNTATDQHLRDVLASYELPRGPPQPSSQQQQQHTSSRQPSPPPPQPLHDPSSSSSGVPSFGSSFGTYANTSNDAGWQLPGARYPFKSSLDVTPGGPSRRSSMASNVHSLLNPADTAEREGEDEGPDERKRKRVL
ncbi:Flocculation suppression protein [Friedmanniomyces endolithicus]|nr:Flocculation suppression protein [Friedmanniomyces endolithicus]KAK0777347.1 Flocculation suppression protein [Friedmanniomyces endolithicus]KAK0778224.1 Flocculation suppression protein [Friedmanniomyces endolithicus]KAK0830161.1 Flocculation suppression protein [Friedmanniomyces endolithicus]KAK0843488.1 Flocculation suppression protein [Friedmanniomyces endolithicus]